MKIVSPPAGRTRRWPFDSRGDAASLAQDKPFDSRSDTASLVQERRIAGAPHGGTARFERLGLAVTSLVLLFGLWLTYAEQTTSFSTFAADMQNGAVVNLTSIRDDSAMLPHLTMFPERTEKAAVAAAVV